MQSALEALGAKYTGYRPGISAAHLERVLEMQKKTTTLGGLRTGWPIFDDKFGGVPTHASFISVPGKPNQGKALSLDSKLKTPSGWIAMRDVRVGYELASIDGGKSYVTGVFPQGVEKTYRVTFCDGRTVVCSGNHLWAVHFVHQYSEGYGDEKHNGWKVFTTDAIRTFCLNGNRKNKHREVFVPMVSGDFGGQVELPVDPWLLGALLGDGGLTSYTPTLTNIDPEIVEHARRIVEALGLQLAQDPGGITYRISGIPNHLNALTQALRALGLMGCNSTSKFIPEFYLNADRATRENLLQGLMDTDGTARQKKETSYSTCSKKLADDVQLLVRSLGGICSISQRHPKCKHKGKVVEGALAYNLNIRMPGREKMFSLHRKRSRVSAAANGRQPRLTIESIEYVGEQLTQCITVSHASRLFITDDYIVTHNSSLFWNLAWRLVDHNNDAVVLVHTVDDTLEKMTPRLLAAKYKLPSERFECAGHFLEQDPSFRDLYEEAWGWLNARVADERLILVDMKDIRKDVSALDLWVKQIAARFSGRPIVVLCDNFHHYEIPTHTREVGAGLQAHISRAVKDVANQHDVGLLMTMELSQDLLVPGVRPRYGRLKGSAGMSYDINANIGVYNDMKDMRHEAVLYWDDQNQAETVAGPGGAVLERPVRKPIVELIFDKSKIHKAFEGEIYFKLDGATGSYEECTASEQTYYADLSHAQQRQLAQKSSRFGRGGNTAAPETQAPPPSTEPQIPPDVLTEFETAARVF